VEHLQHFELSQDPFSNEPDLRFFFESASHRDAQRRVERGLRQRKGLTLLTGDGGMGKTLLARRILDSLEEEIFEATLLVMLPGAADATGVLQRFARQLGTEEPANERPALLGQIYEQLAIVREDGRHTVLMVDDAQIMTPEVFAELGGLLNLEYEDRRLVSILFVGSPDLDRLVENDPSMAPRVDVRVRMQPLDMANTTAYIKHRLAAVNGNQEIIPVAVIETLYKCGRGRPRLLNTLADNALFEAYLAGRTSIDPGDVERAASDLGIGPDPGSTFSPASMASPVPPSPSLEIESTPAMPPVESAAPIIESAIELELTPQMASAADTSVPMADLDAGLEAALEDFENATSGAASVPDLELVTDALEFDVEPAPPAVDAVPAESFSNDSETTSEPELIMAEVELAPLEAGESDEFDDIFVELIEE